MTNWEQQSLFTDEDLGVVHLTKIYTKTGDNGTTAVANNRRVKKDSPIIIAIGKVDTANSAIGLIPRDKENRLLSKIQNDLFDLGADLAGSETIKITNSHIEYLEDMIDGTNDLLEPLRSFVLPTGLLHYARTLIREAELKVWWAMEYETINPLLVVYLNRLSDLLFVMARHFNKGNETLWRPIDG